MADAAPRYLSLPSAEIILSEVRPTKIKPEALLSVNLFVDELLWLILNSARSLSTERLNRDGLTRLLPTGLGKEALLEAEVELKAYWDRTDPVDRGSLIEHNTQLNEFPLQAAFQLMRAKCEVYSTLGDAEEDIEEEDRLQNQMMLASNGPPRASAVAPAALYITAILEHICEHVLTNVAKVVARDSSRTTAHIQDLYVALCEDDSIYPLFKRMKVKEQLEAQAKAASRPRRTKSINTHNSGRGSPSAAARGSTSSPQPRPSAASDLNKGRASGDSAGQPSRSSGEKSRLKMFGGAGGRSPAEGGAGHKRSDSSMSDTTRRTATGVPDLDDMYDSRSDFEDLMRSGATMKVSLTPDRLKTFEVFAKEKGQRVGRSNSISSVNNASSPQSSAAEGAQIPMPSVTASPSSAGPSQQQQRLAQAVQHKTSRSNLVARSATIEEDEDEDENMNDSASPPQSTKNGVYPGNKPRSRTQSLAQFLLETPPWESSSPEAAAPTVPPTTSQAPAIGRARSLTTSSTNSSPLAAGSAAARKLGTTTAHLNSTPPSSFSPARVAGAKIRKPAKNIEDIDLDDLMGDDDEGTEDGGSSISPPPPAHAPAVGMKKGMNPSKDSLARPGGVSSSTREMIDFLSEGPPDEPSLPSSAPHQAHARTMSNAPAPVKVKPQGRFGRMISRLARSSSSEHMSSKKHGADAVSTSKSTPGSLKVTGGGGGAGLPQWTRPTPPPIASLLPAANVTPAPLKSAPATGTQVLNTAPSRVRSNSSARKPAPAMPAPMPAPVQVPAVPEVPPPAVTPPKEEPAPIVPVEEAAPPPKPVQSPSPLPRSSASRPSTAASAATTGTSVAVSSDTKHSTTIPVSPAASVEASPKTVQVPAPAPSPRVSVAVSTSPPVPVETAEKAVETVSSDVEEDTVQAPDSPPSGSVIISAEQAMRMRKMVGQATSAEECRVLVEMFLAQWGLPRSEDEVDADVDVEDEELGMEEQAHQPPLVETLLGDGIHQHQLGEQSEDAQTDDAHDLDPRTPNTPADAILHPDPATAAPGTDTDGDVDDDLFDDDVAYTSQKKMQQADMDLPAPVPAATATPPLPAVVAM